MEAVFFLDMHGYIVCMIYSRKIFNDRFGQKMLMHLFLTSIANIMCLTLPALVNSSGAIYEIYLYYTMLTPGF